MDCTRQILSVIDELKQNINMIEIAANATDDPEAKDLAKNALNILNIAIKKLENIFSRTQDEGEILYILKTVKKRSAEMTTIVLGKAKPKVKVTPVKPAPRIEVLREEEPIEEDEIEIEPIKPSRPDFSKYVTNRFDQNMFDDAIKKAVEEDEEFNARTRAKISQMMREEKNKEEAKERKEEELDNIAGKNLKSWLKSEEDS